MDRIRGLEVFARVAAVGSFSGAARALGLSPAMAIKHVDAIEARLGVRLFHRSTRRVSLTEPGRRYLDGVERVLADLAEADAGASAERLEVAGVLRVNAPVSFGARQLGPLLPQLAERHPGLRVDLGLADRVVDLVEEGWDVAVRIGRLADPNLTARRLAPCRLALAASPDYLARHGRPLRTGDLAAHNCLGYTLSAEVGPRRWSFGPGGEVRVAVSGNLQAGNGDVLAAAAAAGQGIVYQPTFLLADRLRDGTLMRLELEHPAAALAGIHAVYPGARRPPAKVRAFVDFLADSFGADPPWDRDLPPP